MKKTGLLLFIFLSSFVFNTFAADSLDIKFNKLSVSKRIDSLNNLGKASFRYQNYKQAGVYFKKALEYATKTNDKEHMGKLHNNVGIIEDLSGNSFKALEHYKKTLSIYEDIGKKKE